MTATTATRPATFPTYIHFARVSTLNNPRICPHGIAYAHELNMLDWEIDTTEFINRTIPILIEMGKAPSPTNKLGKFPSLLEGVGIINLEVKHRWREQLLRQQNRETEEGSVDYQIQERLDLLAHLARSIWDRDIAYCGPEDSDFARYKAIMFYASMKDGKVRLPYGVDYAGVSKPLIPLFWDRIVNFDAVDPADHPKLTQEQMAHIMGQANKLNAIEGFSQGGIFWCDRFASEQQEFIDNFVSATPQVSLPPSRVPLPLIQRV